MRRIPIAFAAAALALTAACTESKDHNDGNVAAGGQALTVAEVDSIIAIAVSQAQARGAPAAVAVVDREGEVLGVFVMGARDVNGDGRLDAISEGNIQTAIGKAGTAALFQSEQEAFNEFVWSWDNIKPDYNVELEEFAAYFEDLSCMIPRDDHFEYLLLSVFHL